MVRQNPLLGNALLLLVAAIWGSSFGVQAAAMKGMGPLWFTGIRFLIAAIVVAPFALRESRRNGPAHHAASMILSPGIALFFAITLQQVALLGTSIGNAGFLTSLYVLVTPLIGRAVFGRRVPNIFWAAAVIALFGTMLLTGANGSFRWGDGVVVLSSLGWAMQILTLESVVRKFPRPVTIAAVQFCIVGVLGCIAGLIFEPIDWTAVLSIWPHLLFCSVISVGLGYTLQSIGQQHTSATAAAILLSSEAVFAAAVGALAFGERLSLPGVAGALLVIAAVVTVEVSQSRKSHQSNAGA